MLLDVQLLYFALAKTDRNKPWSVLVLEMFMASLLIWNRWSKFEKEKDKIN